jgi:hypothetical protein
LQRRPGEDAEDFTDEEEEEFMIGNDFEDDVDAGEE